MSFRILLFPLLIPKVTSGVWDMGRCVAYVMTREQGQKSPLILLYSLPPSPQQDPLSTARPRALLTFEADVGMLMQLNSQAGLYNGKEGFNTPPWLTQSLLCPLECHRPHTHPTHTQVWLCPLYSPCLKPPPLLLHSDTPSYTLGSSPASLSGNSGLPFKRMRKYLHPNYDLGIESDLGRLNSGISSVPQLCWAFECFLMQSLPAWCGTVHEASPSWVCHVRKGKSPKVSDVSSISLTHHTSIVQARAWRGWWELTAFHLTLLLHPLSFPPFHNLLDQVKSLSHPLNHIFVVLRRTLAAVTNSACNIYGLT